MYGSLISTIPSPRVTKVGTRYILVVLPDSPNSQDALRRSLCLITRIFQTWFYYFIQYLLRQILVFVVTFLVQITNGSYNKLWINDNSINVFVTWRQQTMVKVEVVQIPGMMYLLQTIFEINFNYLILPFQMVDGSLGTAYTLLKCSPMHQRLALLDYYILREY